MSVGEGNVAVGGASTDMVARIAAGDRKAEQEFVDAYARGVRALVRRHCRPNDPIAEDLAQDVLARVLDRLRAGAIRDSNALPAYIQTVVVNATTAEYRSRRVTESDDVLAQMPAHDNPLEQLRSEEIVRVLRHLLE